jgi:DNA processing protein
LPTRTPTPPSLPTPTNDPDERHAFLALALVDGLGARRLATLLSHFGTARAVLDATRSELEATPGIPRDVVSALHQARSCDVAQVLAHSARLGQEILTPISPEYPAALRSIPDPPIALWVRGITALLERPAVAIVGSRDHTAYGEEVARELARAAARAGIAVVSGMARGLDAVAHAAALSVGGATIGVLGNGADVVYPRMNASLFQKMYTDGLILTEHPPGDRNRPGAFPRRNRLISGLARATVIVEAAEGSGTLLTCTAALEQGRDVFVVPGPITASTSRGTNRLLRDGATPLLDVADLLAYFGTSAVPAPGGPVPPPPCTLSPTEARVLGALSDAGRHLDDLAFAVGLPIGELLATLLGLEIGGLAQALPGGHYRRRERR